MRGRVFKLNKLNWLVAIDTSDGSGQTFSIFKLDDTSEIAVDDDVSWKNDRVLGSATVTNHSTGRQMSVIFENHDVPRSLLLMQLRLEG